MNRKEQVMSNFTQGYNCAQSVALAFADLTGVQREELARLCSSFGGGMGRLREVCGAVSGMFMIAGLLYGYDQPETGEPKAEHYARIQELARQFEAEYGTIICRELLGSGTKRDDPTPEQRTEEYYRKRPCKEIVGHAAELLERFIARQAAED